MHVPTIATLRGRVLVVDDDRSTRSATASLLAQEGYSVETAPDGASALELAAAHPPDLVVTDLMMPGMDGIALLKTLRARHPDLPIIVATGTWDLTSAVRAVRDGAYDYLAKPFDFEMLARMVERALAKRKSA